ncbi:MAG: hypothetical protein ACRESR_06525, partial [Gammaproteobacteria bacterium]
MSPAYSGVRRRRNVFDRRHKIRRQFRPECGGVLGQFLDECGKLLGDDSLGNPLLVKRGEYEHRDVIGGSSAIGLPRLNLGPGFLNDLCARFVGAAFADLNRLMHKTGERRLPGEVEFKRPLFRRKHANRST